MWAGVKPVQQGVQPEGAVALARRTHREKRRRQRAVGGGLRHLARLAAAERHLHLVAAAERLDRQPHPLTSVHGVGAVGRHARQRPVERVPRRGKHARGGGRRGDRRQRRVCRWLGDARRREAEQLALARDADVQQALAVREADAFAHAAVDGGLALVREHEPVPPDVRAQLVFGGGDGGVGRRRTGAGVVVVVVVKVEAPHGGAGRLNLRLGANRLLGANGSLRANGRLCAR